MDSRTRKNREILSFFFSKAVLVEADLRKMEKWIKDREMDSDTKIFLKNLVTIPAGMINLDAEEIIKCLGENAREVDYIIFPFKTGRELKELIKTKVPEISKYRKILGVVVRTRNPFWLEDKILGRFSRFVKLYKLFEKNTKGGLLGNYGRAVYTDTKFDEILDREMLHLHLLLGEFQRPPNV